MRPRRARPPRNCAPSRTSRSWSAVPSPRNGYVARALAAAPSIGRVVAIGPPEDLRKACGDLLADVIPEAGGSVVENLVSGLAALPAAPRVPAAATDIPPA